jgi:uncharacterized protein
MADTVRLSVVHVPSFDGTSLAISLFLPSADRFAPPYATLVEALPYRMHDVTSSYDETYLRYADDGGFAVVRLDLRGTGSSGGIIDDEYTDTERADIRSVIEWIAAQPWSTGRVGMFGTSWSGFNSLQVACDGVPQLGAIVATYATDDRATDDVHLFGGAIRALDLIDYPLYMVAKNALPPVPAVWDPVHGHGDWRRQWLRRIDETPPWLLRWMYDPHDSPNWRRGSVRLGPHGEGYERISCPTMLIAGWADGYRNNTFRTIVELERNGTPWRLLAGPWSHKDPSTARPGPNVDADREIIAWFDEHLRDGPPSAARPAQVFVRHPVPAQFDLKLHPGRWVEFDAWPPPGHHLEELRPDGDAHDVLVVEGDVGVAAWNSCAGGLPWGQSLDQRSDDARSITYEFEHTVARTMIGHAAVTMRVASSAHVGHVSVKLCDVDPLGHSTLITRGYLDLQYRGCWPADGNGVPGAPRRPLVPGEFVDVRIELEAAAWELQPGHRLRVAIAGTDWPNVWPAAGNHTLTVDRASVQVELPVTTELDASAHQFGHAPGPWDGWDDGVEWRIGGDVVRREGRVDTRYGGPYDGRDGIRVVDECVGALGISLADLERGWARGHATFDLALPLPDGQVVCGTRADLEVTSDADAFHVTITLTASENGVEIRDRRWTATIPR